MTLQKSQLLLPSLCDIATQALCGQGQYGEVTRIARAHEVTRQTVYRVREAGHQALVAAFSPQPPSLWNPDVPEAIVKRSLVALYTVAPGSIDDIVELLPILYGGMTRSHGYIWNVLHQAQDNAFKFLDGIDLSDVRSVALDEMFWHNNPVLTGIDLDSGLWFSAEKVRHRSGAEWVSRLEALKTQGLEPLHIVKDAGTAMEEACSVVFPDADRRDDLFHAIAILNELARHFDNIAYRCIARFDKAAAKRQHAQVFVRDLAWRRARRSLR